MNFNNYKPSKKLTFVIDVIEEINHTLFIFFWEYTFKPDLIQIPLKYKERYLQQIKDNNTQATQYRFCNIKIEFTDTINKIKCSYNGIQ